MTTLPDAVGAPPPGGLKEREAVVICGVVSILQSVLTVFT
jgi:hypothetical protein